MAEIKATENRTVDIVSRITEKIKGAENVLVALSKSPDVDELAAAIGLTLVIDRLGKHGTAIFSGTVPNALEFLQPEKTFEKDTNSLQDFIIALNKEKADHLRYKIDGEYVKVFITPYKTTIDENDLEFSHGDYNVDLVISLNVDSLDELDSALAEHGKILHNAIAIDITVEEPGKFGEIEWSDPGASSVSEMVAVIATKLGKADIFDKTIATALLTGMVAATNRFSNERTTPGAMALAGKLMAAGADQQLIASNIPVDGVVMAGGASGEAQAPADATTLRVSRSGEEPTTVEPTEELEKVVDEPAATTGAEGPLMDELRHAAEPKLDIRAEESKPEAEEAKPEVEEPKPEAEVAPTEGGGGMAVVQPLGAAATAPTPAEDVPPAVVPVPTGLESASEPAESEPDVNKPKDYAELMAEELAKPLPYELEQNPAAASAPEVPGGPEVNHVPEMDYGSGEDKAPEMAAPSGESYVVGKPQTVIQPINTIAPDGGPSVVATSGGGDIGGAPMAGSVVPITANEAAGSATPTEGQVLPPPPPPPPPQPGMMMPGVPAGEVQLPQVAEGQAAAESTQQDVQIPEAQPVLQDQVYPQQANDPGAFKIPGT